MVVTLHMRPKLIAWFEVYVWWRITKQGRYRRQRGY